MSDIKLSVIIPAYNEENRLAKTLRAIDEYLKTQEYAYEILVVDDGSVDRTRQVANELSSSIKGLRVVGDAENHGKGYAVRKGMLEAKGEYRIFMDADNSTSIDQVEKMWPLFEKGAQVIIGSRDIAGAQIARHQPWWREGLGNVFNLIVQMLSGLWGIWDTQCGFKGFSQEAAQNIFPRAAINRWAFDVELLVLAKKLGYEIKEVPVMWINDKQSKVTFLGMVKMLVEVARIALNKRRGTYDK